MDSHKYNERNRPPFQPSNLTNSSNYNSKISGIIEQAHSLNTLYVMAAFCQILLGIAVISISVLGFIQPIWLSTMLSMLASVTVMIGIYFLYATVTHMRDPNRLIGNAIRRVIDAQN